MNQNTKRPEYKIQYAQNMGAISEERKGVPLSWDMWFRKWSRPKSILKRELHSLKQFLIGDLHF